jgi:hypothetical protein
MTTPRVGLSVLGPALAFALLMSNYVCSSKAQIKPEAFHWTIDGSQVVKDSFATQKTFAPD